MKKISINYIRRSLFCSLRYIIFTAPHTQQREEPRARGASHRLALMGNCHTLHPHVFAQSITAQKMKFSIKDFSSKLRIWSHLLKKSLMENFIFCAVHPVNGILLVNSLLCVGHWDNKFFCQCYIRYEFEGKPVVHLKLCRNSFLA